VRNRPPIRITPSLLAADFCRLGDEIAGVEAAGAEALHLDVMDGHFVPNLSIGVPIVRSVSRCTRLPLDTHLMIEEPGRYAPAFVEAGSTSITFHIEATDRPRELAREIRRLGVSVGVSLNPGTPPQALWPALPEVAGVLVMTVWPGFGGQTFIEDCVAKLRAVAAELRPDQWLAVDGGIGPDTVARAVAAGADTLVAGSAVFGTASPGAAVAELRRLAEAALRVETEHPA